ncbi:MAG: DUF2953 domain-containing protein [Vicinamibacterales bacterium]
MTTAWLLVAVAGGLSVLVIAALSLPVWMDVRLDTGLPPATRHAVSIDARWAGLAWHRDLPSQESPAAAPARRRPPRHGPARTGRRRLSVAAMWRSPGFAAAARRLLADLLRTVRPYDARGVVLIGTDDPAETGEIYGWLQAAAGWTHGIGGRLHLVPVFDGPCLAARAALRWRVRPVAVLRPLAVFGLSPATWRAVRAGWQRRRAA